MQFHLFLHPGPSICHPLRTRTRGTPRCGRYTALTCLICEALVYRVVLIDIEEKEVPLLPTEEWVEDEIMKSSSGWIEVSNQRLVSDRCFLPLTCVVGRLPLTVTYDSQTDNAVQAMESSSTIHHCFPWYCLNYPRLLRRSR